MGFVLQKRLHQLPLTKNQNQKVRLKITALLLGGMSFSAFAEQTVDIEIRGIKGERAIRNTDMNVKLIDKAEMDGSDRNRPFQLNQ